MNTDADADVDADVDPDAGPASAVGVDEATAATAGNGRGDDGLGRRIAAWYGKWYLRLYAVLSVCIVLGAGYGYATGALSWWNAGSMVVVLAALTLFVRWRRTVDPAFGANEQ